VRALLIRHRVADYDTWKRVFDGDADTCRAHGSGMARVFRSDSDPDEVWLLMEWDDLARARLFTRSDDLLDLIERAGVTDRPDYWYLEETDSSRD
jgi:hypothetical protein